MAWSTPVANAITRLHAYIGTRYDAVTKPYGLAGDGYKTNLPVAFNDMGTVADAVGQTATAIDAAQSSISTMNANVNTKHDEVVTLAGQAQTARDQAQAAAASVNLPAITAADAGKGLEVKSDGSGWQLVGYLKAAGGTLTGWLQTYAGVDATNLGLRIGEATSGFYRSGAGVLGFVANGVEVFRTAATGALTFYKAVVPKVVTVNWGSTITLDLTAGNKFTVTLGGATAFANPTLTAAMVGMEFTIIPTQDANGNRTQSYGSFFKFPNGTAPTGSTAAGKRDRVICEVVSTTAIDAVFVKGF